MAHKIFISPSDQTANTYAGGGTTEAIQCGKIGIATKAALEQCGFEVMLLQYATMAEKCAASDAFGAELHMPIHSNGFNKKVTGTRIFYGVDGSEGHRAAKSILARLGPVTPGSPDMVQAYPALYEIRVPKAPTAYIEADFHDVEAVADWIVDNTMEIAVEICKGVCDYFGVEYIAEFEMPCRMLEFEELLRLHEKALEDNDAGAWSEEARQWAIREGIVNGIGYLEDGTPNYAWEAHVTREQMVTMLYRAIGG